MHDVMCIKSDLCGHNPFSYPCTQTHMLAAEPLSNGKSHLHTLILDSWREMVFSPRPGDLEPEEVAAIVVATVIVAVAAVVLIAVVLVCALKRPKSKTGKFSLFLPLSLSLCHSLFSLSLPLFFFFFYNILCIHSIGYTHSIKANTKCTLKRKEKKKERKYKHMNEVYTICIATRHF